MVESITSWRIDAAIRSPVRIGILSDDQMRWTIVVAPDVFFPSPSLVSCGGIRPVFPGRHIVY